VLAVVGGILMLGPGQTIAGVEVPLPFALVAASPLRFVRYPFRFLGVVVLGRALLLAAAVQAVRDLLPRRVGALVVLAVVVAIVAARGPRLPGRARDTIRSVHEPAYELVKRIAEQRGPAPILELPVLLPNEKKLYNEGDMLIGATRHGLPLVVGHTGFYPPHRPLVMHAIMSLPQSEAAQILVDMTHMGWVLLRPPAQWPARLQDQRNALVRAPWLSRAASLNGWVLMRVKLKPRRENFFEAIAAGWEPGTTALGTPVAPIAAERARAAVNGRPPREVARDVGVLLELRITNNGDTTWPVSVPTLAPPLEPPYDGEVHLQATWRRLGAPLEPPRTATIQLRRDVRPHETVVQVVVLRTPPKPGQYELEVAVRQRSGEGFTSPPSRALRGRVKVK
jgi:hypothetical protein